MPLKGLNRQEGYANTNSNKSTKKDILDSVMEISDRIEVWMQLSLWGGSGKAGKQGCPR